MVEKKKPIDVIAALLEDKQPFPAQYLHIFSDITPADLEAVKKVWPQVSVKRKINLLQDLESLMEADTLVSCDDFARFALQDEDPNVRTQSISLLWECEDTGLIAIFGDLLTNDANENVRAAAADALGKFILLGELEEIPARSFRRAFDILIRSFPSELFEGVQQQIVRSLSYSSDDKIFPLIQEAYARPSKSWRIAALESMGRSADDRWKANILEMMHSLDEDYQYEAVRAAGEIELKAAKSTLLDMLLAENQNSDLRYQIIWALSKIGGRDVREKIREMLENTEDEEEIDVLEIALDNLELSEDDPSLEIF